MDQNGRAVVIVGGGQAGARTAKSLRAIGYDGALTLIGAENHSPYERPDLSKACLLDAAAMPPSVIDAAFCTEQRIALITARQACAIDRQQRDVLLDDGTQHPYDRLVLATGCKPRRLSLAGLDTRRVFYLRTLDDARALRPRLQPGSSIVIVGGGFIGLEVAAGAQALGCQVSVLEAAPVLLPRLGSTIASEKVLDHHRRAGIDIRLDTRIAYVDGTRLVLSTGAEAAGHAVDDGIHTSECGETWDGALRAAGDGPRHFNPLLQRHLRLESWQNANLQPEAVARTIMGERVAYAEIPWLWSDQGDLNLQAAGAPAQVDMTVQRGGDSTGVSIFQFACGALVGGITINRGKDMPVIRRLLRQAQPIDDPEALADDSKPLRAFLRAGAAS